MLFSKFSYILISVLLIDWSLGQRARKPGYRTRWLPQDYPQERRAQPKSDRGQVYSEYPDGDDIDVEFERLNQTKPTILDIMSDKGSRLDCSGLIELGGELLVDDTYCDITLNVTDTPLNDSFEFCAHKCILSLRSTVLSAKIAALVQKFPTSHRPTLVLDGLNPTSFIYVLQYIYTGTIDSNFDIKQNILHLFVAADYLNLQVLMELIKEYLNSNLVTTKEIANFILIAEKYIYTKIKIILIQIIRNKFNMTAIEWREFIKVMCHSEASQNATGRFRVRDDNNIYN